MLDSHCHLDDPRFDSDLEAVLQRARAAGVSSWICAGFSPERAARQRRIAAQHPNIHLAFGLHPWRVATCQDDEEAQRLLTQLEGELAQAPPSLVALGELGLDHLRRFDKDTHPRQRRLFRAQLDLARQRELPVILHVVRAHGAVLEVLRGDGLPAAGGVMHSYSGSAELVREYVDLGLHISFSGAVTHPRAKKLRAAAVSTPGERLLVETDAPDQPPHALERDARNEPAHLLKVLESLAQLRETEVRVLAERCDANGRGLFGLLGRPC